MKFVGIIPARFASTRFPGKPLVEIHGVSMIRRVYERAMSAGVLSHVVVATDDARIFDHVSLFGKAVYTSPDHQSGTDRCYEAAMKLKSEWSLSDDDVIVNIQGDEPFIHPEQIQTLCDSFMNPKTAIATLKKRIVSEDQLFNENVVKVVSDENNRAVYFSRATIPFMRNFPKDQWLAKGVFFKHIGLYAYRFKILAEITDLPDSKLEKAESLEQLRWLEHGYRVNVHETRHESHAVDTPSDLENFK
jgi:3-deoxy-manno-octulosonate cytidylyltransferase (CMP-KDO synthetase)